MLTLNSLLRENIPLLPLTTGWNGSRSFSHVTIIEDTKVEKWMRGGEFLLVNTATLSALDDVEAFLGELCELRCAALAVKQSVSAPLSEGLISSASRLHLPLFKINDDATYLDVMAPLNKLLVENERKSFFDELTARHLLSAVVPSLDDLQLTGVNDFHVERIVVLYTSVIPQTAKTALEPSEIAPLMDRVTSTLTDALDGLEAQGLADTHIVLTETFDLQALLFIPPQSPENTIFNRLETSLGKQMSLPIGVSHACPCETAHEAALQAEFAFRAKDVTVENGSPVRRYQDVELYRLVDDLANSKETASLFEQTDRLALHPQLFETLSTYFRLNESLKLTSEHLFIHVNTLRYRLDQVTKLTGLSPASTSDKVRLFLGIIHLRQKKAQSHL